MLHVKKLRRVLLFQAPQKAIEPLVVAPGEEYIELITDGRVRFDDGGVSRWYGAGTFFWHLAGQETVYDADLADPYECLALRFQVAPGRRHPPPRVTVWKTPDQARAFAWELLEAIHHPDTDIDALGRYAYARFDWMSRNQTPAPVHLPPPVRFALEELERTLVEDIPVEVIARRVGVSVSGLHNLFRKHLSSSPHQVRTNLRMLKARQILATGGDTVKEVAAACGFANVENFCRRFRQHVGQSPGAYRKRNQIPVKFYQPHETIEENDSGGAQ